MEETLDDDVELAKLKPKLVNITHILEHVSEPSNPPADTNHSSQRPSVVEVEDEDDAKAPFKHNTVDPREVFTLPHMF